MTQAAVNADCNMYQGVNYDKKKQLTVGHLLYLKVAGIEIPAKLNVDDPENPESKKDIVAVLDVVRWNGAITDEIVFEGEISVPGVQAASQLTLANMTKDDVEFEFVVFKFDPIKQQLYKRFHTNAQKLKGNVKKNGENYVFGVGEDPSGTFGGDPKTHTFFLEVKSSDKQDLHVLTSVDGKNAVQWGLPAITA